MKKILRVIIALIIIIIFIILIILYLNKIELENFNKDNTIGDEGQNVEIINKIEDIDNSTDFKIVESCIQQYYDINNNNNSSFFGYNDNGDYEKILSDEEINDIRLNFLSKEYINKNNITSKNVSEFVSTNDEKVIIIALKMKKVINTVIDKYLVQAIAINLNYEFLDEFYIYVNLDKEKNIFSIEPIGERFDNIEDIEIKNENLSINKNDYNQYIKMVLSYEDIAKKYMMTYKMLVLSRPELIYNFLDNDYKEKRYGSLEEFKSYIKDNNNEIRKLKLKEYLVNNKENSNEYVCKDQNDNLYIFEEILPMNYTLKFDTYTIMTEKFKTTYETASNEQKVQMNIDKFIQMINRQDYRTSYNCIADSFKNNYFNTQEEFKSYIKNKFFTYNKFKVEKIEQKGNNIYVCSLQLTDLTEESTEIKKVDIIMKLNDNFDFEMSFAM